MTRRKRITSIAALVPIIAVALPLVALPVSSFAAGEAGDSGAVTKKDNGKKAAKKKFTVRCFKGKIWNKNKKKCVKEQASSSLDQDSIYTYGRDLARAGQYDNAIRVLYLAHDQSDPRVLNYLGYSNRKLGNIEIALGYYRAAVASNPDFTLVREYLGEAYIQLGQLEKAREQLTQIERICGSQICREYSMLSKYIVDSQLR